MVVLDRTAATWRNASPNTSKSLSKVLLSQLQLHQYQLTMIAVMSGLPQHHSTITLGNSCRHRRQQQHVSCGNSASAILRQSECCLIAGMTRDVTVQHEACRRCHCGCISSVCSLIACCDRVTYASFRNLCVCVTVCPDWHCPLIHWGVTGSTSYETTCRAQLGFRHSCFSGIMALVAG